MLERGQAKLSIPYFERAIGSDPRFADAYFNLAMAWEQLGDRARSRPNWKKYVDLEPSGAWADIARDHLRT
jgi:tetratricopeptide (TPR) repeat protein